jgi:ribonuclease HI
VEGALEIYIDGASFGNPGPSGAGVVIRQNKRIKKTLSLHIGEATNNVAEYMALIFGLQEALILGAKNVILNTDSQLLVHQINGQYKIKSSNLKPLYQQSKYLLSHLNSVELKYISRQENKLADRLAREAIRNRDSLHQPNRSGTG